MKKRLIFLIGILTVLCCIGLTACGGSDDTASNDAAESSDSPYVGEWIMTDMSLGDESEELGHDYKLIVNADGTGTLEGEDEVSEFTWKPTKNGFKTKGDLKVKFKADGENAIHAKIFGVSLNFVKAGSEDAAAAEDTEAAAAPAVDASKYGYTGDDPAIAAVYKYLAEDVAATYQPGKKIKSVPVVLVVAEKDGTDCTTEVYGDFWVNNYKKKGKTLKCVSGGNHPGVMHVTQDGDTYTVTGFDQVADGGDFEPSAKEIFGDDYDAFMEINSDSDAIEKERAKVLADYVKANDLNVKKYKDPGWKPVKLEL